jgi:hypothetical protein
MANLQNFVSRALHGGSSVDIYLNRTPRIGSAKLEVVQPLQLRTSGAIKVFGFTVTGAEIDMPDESPSGTCTVKYNGGSYACPYHVDGAYLKIQIQGREVSISADGTWTWIGVGGFPGWIGIWPAGAGAEPTKQDFASAPDAAGAPV